MITSEEEVATVVSREDEVGIVLGVLASVTLEVIAAEDMVATAVALEQQTVSMVEVTGTREEEIEEVAIVPKDALTAGRSVISLASALKVPARTNIEKKQPNRGPKEDNGNGNGNGGNNCFNCGGSGHFSRECTQGAYIYYFREKALQSRAEGRHWKQQLSSGQQPWPEQLCPRSS